MPTIALGGLGLDDPSQHQVLFSDNLLLGRSSIDLERHVGHRAAEGKFYRVDAGQIAEQYAQVSRMLNLGVPVTVVGAPRARNLLAVAWFAATGRAHTDLVWEVGVGTGGTVRLLSGGASMDWALELWRLFAERQPSELAGHLIGGPLELPIRELASVYSAHFPSMRGGAVLPSRLDAAILRSLPTDWATPVQILIRAFAGSSRLQELVAEVGDNFFARRLRDWARVSASVSFRPAPGRKGSGPIRAGTFRSTATVDLVLASGLKRADYPRIVIGCASPYECEEGELESVARLEQFGATPV